MAVNKLYNFYGAKYSKSGDKVNVTIVHSNENNSTEYATIILDPARTNTKTQVCVKEDYILIKVPFLKDDGKKEAKKSSKKTSDPFDI